MKFARQHSSAVNTLNDTAYATPRQSLSSVMFVKKVFQGGMMDKNHTFFTFFFIPNNMADFIITRVSETLYQDTWQPMEKYPQSSTKLPTGQHRHV